MKNKFSNSSCLIELMWTEIAQIIIIIEKKSKIHVFTQNPIFLLVLHPFEKSLESLYAEIHSRKALQISLVKGWWRIHALALVFYLVLKGVVDRGVAFLEGVVCF